MEEKVLTDNQGEKIVVRWDGDRFAVVKRKRVMGEDSYTTIILSVKEMLDLVEFVSKIGGD